MISKLYHISISYEICIEAFHMKFAYNIFMVLGFKFVFDLRYCNIIAFFHCYSNIALLCKASAK